ncbi:defensin-2-like [Athalia rosae]|uniref:defensin-2-like n=1 Tax=Athalia rosae TaxID=37344 RepID=UPI000625F0DF|nr:defensin-2-like [Athalia rosae]
MKLLVALVAAFTVCAFHASAAVIPEHVYDGSIQGTYDQEIKLEDVDTNEGLFVENGNSPARHRRFTCDVLSVATKWITINHAACAARCIAQKHKGGSCKGGVCHCRG